MSEEVIKRKPNKRAQANPHYVNNVEFTKAIADWIEENNGKDRTNWSQIPPFVVECFLKLIDHYALKGSFRGYCVDSETEALTKRGWLKYNEITLDDNILSYSNGDLKWSTISNLYIDNYHGDMFKLTVQGMDALVTPKHKFITNNGLKEVDYMINADKIILMGNPLKEDNQKKEYADDFVEMIGWIVTEGNIYKNKKCTNSGIHIYQSEGKNANKIRSCLDKQGILYHEYKKLSKNKEIIRFSLSTKVTSYINSVIPNKNLTMDFILKLTYDQRLLLFQTMIEGDGWKRNLKSYSYSQKDNFHTDMFLVLCTLLGKRVTFRNVDIVSFGKPTTINIINIFSENTENYSNVVNINFHGSKTTNKGFIGKDKSYYPNKANQFYDGVIWCPTTEYGSFMARRNGTIYLTGNSYLDLMKSEAIYNCLKYCHNFDITKSQNAFAYFTQYIHNSFCQVLNSEKKEAELKYNSIDEMSTYNYDRINLYDEEHDDN